MSLVERQGTSFERIDEVEIMSDNKFLQLLEIKYKQISEMGKFNKKYEPINKGRNQIVNKLANSETTKNVFDILKVATTVGIIGYSAVTNTSITQSLGNFVSILPGVGNNLSGVITSPSGNSIITQLLVDNSLASAVTKIIDEVNNRKDMIKDFAIDKMPERLKKKYFENQDKIAEKKQELENQYPTDKEIYESNNKLYNEKSKELVKELFSKNKPKEVNQEKALQPIQNANKEITEEKAFNPWEVTQEQMAEQRRINELREAKTIQNSKSKDMEII